MLIESTIGAGDTDRLRAYYLTLAFVCVLLCLPLWSTQYVPLVDYPNHLARCYVVSQYDKVSVYQATYDRLIEPIPNLAMDLVMLPMLKFLDVQVAGKIFLTLIVLLFGLGCHLLGQAIHGRPGWLTLPCVFLSYNSMLFYGFLNYLFGLGLFLITLALWIKYRKNWRAASVAGVCLLVCACYLAHLSAYVFLATALFVIGCFDLWSRRASVKSVVTSLLPLLLPLVGFRLFMKGSGMMGEVAWNGVRQKLINSVSWIVTYNYYLDLLFALSVLVVLLILLPRVRGLRVNWIVFAAAASLGLLFVASPETLFTSHSADIRFIPPAIVLALMSVRFVVPARAGKAALALILAASSVRAGGVWYEWQRTDKKIAAQVSLFEHLPEGAGVYPVVILPTGIQANKREKPLAHIIHYATIYRHTSSPTLFALRGQQSLHFKQPFTYYPFGLSVAQPLAPDQVDWPLIRQKHDYLWCYNLSDSYIAYLKERCTLIAEAGDGMIFRVNHANSAQALEGTRPVTSASSYASGELNLKR